MSEDYYPWIMKGWGPSWFNDEPFKSYRGQRCRMLAKSRRMWSCLIEFIDDFRVVTDQRGLRKWDGQLSLLDT